MSFMTYLTKFPVHVALARKPEKTQRWRVDDPEFRHRAVMGLFPILRIIKRAPEIIFSFDMNSYQVKHHISWCNRIAMWLHQTWKG